MGGKREWEEVPNHDCPDIDNLVQQDTGDIEKLKKMDETRLKDQGINFDVLFVDALKKMCETELKRGIDVAVFVLDANNHRVCIKNCTREEALEAKKPGKGCTMYIIKRPKAHAESRLMKAVKDEGMPTL